ncbi:MAG: GspH/FimT family pseudopilin [Gammaproteobacteria bacterium]|nr:GspH/FimT family pseudopilin [Gammaproteobacteria bacterium]
MTFSSAPTGANSRGFTLIELVLVIVIAAILAAVAGPRFFDPDTFAHRGYADALAAALRSAQKAAVASDCPAELELSATGYAVMQQAPAGNACNPQDTTWSQPVLGLDGVAVAGQNPAGTSAAPTGAFVFDGSGALSSAPASSIAVGGETVQIDPVSGLVTVSAP